MNRRPPLRPPHIPSPPRSLIGQAHQRLMKMLADDPNLFNNLSAAEQQVMHDYGTMQSSVLQRAFARRGAMRDICIEIIFNENYYNGTYQFPPERMIRNCLFFIFRNLDSGYVNLLFAPPFIDRYRATMSDSSMLNDERLRLKYNFSEAVRNAINSMRLVDIIELMRPYRL